MKNKNIIIALVVIPLVLVVIVFLYGYISWNVYKKTTFLSLKKDCFPTITRLRETKVKEISLQEKLFGGRCVTF